MTIYTAGNTYRRRRIHAYTLEKIAAASKPSTIYFYFRAIQLEFKDTNCGGNSERIETTEDKIGDTIVR